jgi:hypothetical protein
MGGLIQQVRQARADIKGGVAAVGALDKKVEDHQKATDIRFSKLSDEFVRRDYWMAKVQSIEDEQKATRAATERIEHRIDTLMIQTKG